MSNIEYPIFKPVRFKESKWERGFIQENEDNTRLVVNTERKPVLFVDIKNGWF